jgi:hypothetical protein
MEAFRITVIQKNGYRRTARVLLTLMFLSLSLGVVSCQDGGAFGMSADGLARILAGKDPTPVLSLDEASLGDTGAFGPAAYYYLARWLDSRINPTVPTTATATDPEPAAKLRLLFRMAYDRASGIVKQEAGLALIGQLSSAGQWDELLGFSADFSTAMGASWQADRTRLDALDALGRHDEIAAFVSRLASAYPDEAAKDADALSWFGAVANLRSGGKTWANPLRRILLERPASVWTARAYDLAQAEPKVRALFSQEELHALAMRDAVGAKDYGLAYTEALLGPNAAMGRSSSQAMVADAGKAFLNSGQLKEGATRFIAVGWTARYYKARFARALERWREARVLFRKAAADAPTKADADAARWYAADCAYRAALAGAGTLVDSVNRGSGKAALSAVRAAAREVALNELVAASELWSDPAYFSDLVDGLFRDALRERDWRLIEQMERRLGPRLAPDTAARVAYTAARAYELGFVAGSSGVAGPKGADAEGDAPETRATVAAVRFAAIADQADAALFYRALAAWRAGIEPTVVLPDRSPPATAAAVPKKSDETEGFVAGLAGFGLGDIAVAEVRTRRADLGDDALRRLAARLYSLGRPDCAIRLTLLLGSRPARAIRRSDYELLYPRPYLGEIRGLRLEPRISEWLTLGLLRSESAFRADAVSRAGAIGLSQLMPATAAEQAKALGLTSYDLMEPKDNLGIGLAHFGSLLERTGGRPMRAMMAYNAGWGRLRTWTAESGDLPDDIMVEAIGIEETRQYCRNILQAAVMYGELYYGKNVGDTVQELVGGV